MRCSISLALIAFLARFAYGFSVTPPRLVEPLRVGAAGAASKPARDSKEWSASAQTIILTRTRGGALDLSKNSPITVESKCPVTGLAAIFGSLYGTFGVVYILIKAVKRVLPIAMEPFQAGAVPLTQFQLG